jgi:hypothetical protein
MMRLPDLKPSGSVEGWPWADPWGHPDPGPVGADRSSQSVQSTPVAST